MLNVKKLYDTLNKMICVNVEQVVLCNKDGAVLCSAGDNPLRAQSVAGLFVQLWQPGMTEVIVHFEVAPPPLTRRISPSTGRRSARASTSSCSATGTPTSARSS